MNILKKKKKTVKKRLSVPVSSISYINSWVCLLFFLMCYLARLHSLSSFESRYEYLTSKVQLLCEKKNDLLLQNILLKQRIESSSDKKWVEKLLIENMGLVPANSQKARIIHRQSHVI